MAKKPNGYILYEGPSAIDGKPIVVIATGFASKSDNGKTGDMIQTWILRADISPSEALASGDDESICGGCEHRPALRTKNESEGKKHIPCYVKVWQAPRSVYECYKRGGYQRIDLMQAAQLCAGRMVRFGSYGDPRAVPIAVWRAMSSMAEGWTGYTHQWRNVGKQAAQWAKLVMASADSLADMNDAHALGFRTFRVTAKPFENVRGLESVCPASKEKGAVTDCATCRACMGTSSKARASIQIARH